jgi:hypothetical protein
VGWQQNARRWFGGVPTEIKLCGVALTHAQEALDYAGPREEHFARDDAGERPGEDWPAVMLLKLARLQLGEMAQIIEMMLGVPLGGMSVDDVGFRLGARARLRLDGEDLEAALWEVDALMEALQLRDALAGDLRVAHGFQVDGSITITTGPDIPETSVVGLKGSVGGELADEPDEILRLAVRLTEAAASIYWRLGGAPAGATPSPTGLPRNASDDLPLGVRKVSGPDDFVAASVMAHDRSDLTFEQCLALARLVLKHEGGPAPTSGKKAVMPIATARHLNKLGLAALMQAGEVEALYEATGGHVRVVGSRDRSRWHVMATDDGRSLVTSALSRNADPGNLAPTEGPPTPSHPPLDRQQFGQLTLAIKRANPTQDEVARAVQGLIQEAMTYRSGPEVLDLMRRVGRFTSLAPFNALLLDAQSPGCQHVLPAHAWKESWHRRVKAGERPHIILKTFGPVLLVFDVSQVEPIDDSAPALPKEIVDPFGMPAVSGVEGVLSATIETAKVDGLRVTRTVDGASSAGSARSRWAAGSIQIKKGPRSRVLDVPVTVDIEINDNLDPTAAYITLAHELGHVYCGHLGSRDLDMWPDRHHLSETAEECEAEAVAYIAGLRLDPNVSMPPHLAQYLKPGSPVPPIDLEVVTKAAGLVLDLHEAPDVIWRRRVERAKKAERRRQNLQ